MKKETYFTQHNVMTYKILFYIICNTVSHVAEFKLIIRYNLTSKNCNVKDSGTRFWETI